MTSQQLQELRYKCQTDLFFLGKTVLGKDLEEQPHREMCDFFTKKNPKVDIYETDVTKNRILQCPRGSFKSSVDVLDAVQWTICYPNVRILVLTAEKKLAQAFAEEFRYYFEILDPDNPTEFQMLFPEHCVPASKREPSTEFTTPARTVFKKEPTLWANSIGSSLPGWHCDVLKCDDVVNNINAKEPEQVEKTVSAFNYARKLVDPGGYVDVVGTPYDPNDLYAFIQRNAEDLKVLSRPAWAVKADSKSKSPDELAEDDYDLYFPKRLSYKFLTKEKKYDINTFESQYLINAKAFSAQIFDRELLEKSIISWKSIPQQVSYYAAWDLAYGQKINTDFTAGFVVAVDSNHRLYIIDGVRGRFSGADISYKIADFMRRYNLQMTGIEDMLGAQWLSPEIERAAQQVGVVPKVHYIPVDKGKDAKMNRIVHLVTLMKERRLFFSDGLQNIEDVLTQFEKFTGSKNGKDDVPDCISFFPKFIPVFPQSLQENQINWKKIREEYFIDQVFSQSTPIPQQTVYEEPPEIINYF